MAKVGGQAGNTNAASTKPRSWAEAIDKALKQSQEGKPNKLRQLADVIIKKALDGDMQAIKEVGDRVDGKALATIDMKATHSLADMTLEQLQAELDKT